MNGSREARAALRTSVVTCVFVLGLGACTRGEAPRPPIPAEPPAGGAGTRAKGEEGSMGNPVTASPATQLAASATASPPDDDGRRGLAPRPNAAPPTGPLSAFGMAGAPAGNGPVLGHGGGSAPLTFDAPPAPVAPAPRLNPNARYATTYRPGGAALAAFDAAIARGQIPATYKDLVGDFGARYAPAIGRPEGGALAVAADTERAAAGPGGGSVNLRVSLVGSEVAPPRAQLSVHIVLDTSGSMSGQAIDDARKAAEAVVARLAPTDDFSMVTFSDQAHLLVGDAPIGWRRDDVLHRIDQVRADGGTNISSGLDLGYTEAHASSIPVDAVRIVMLLSDGHANGGDTSPQSLAQRASNAFQDGIQTSSFGLGPDFDAALMSRIADRGAGGYYYLADSSQIGVALERELDARLQPVATAVELRVRLRPDVSASKIFGSRALTGAEASAVRAQEVALDTREAKKGIERDRQADAEGGMRLFIPAFARADRHATLLTLELPPGVGERSVASVELRYKDRLLQKNVTRELPVRVRYAASDAESAATCDPSIERLAQAFAAGETILAAAERVDAGDRVGAARILDERVDVLKRASAALHEPMLAEDGARLARLSTAVGGSGALSDPLPLVVMLRGSGYGYL